MKKFILALVACAMALGIVTSSNALVVVGDPFDGGSWGQTFKTNGPCNLVNLFSTLPFRGGELPLGWNYRQSNHGYWAQGFTTGTATIVQWIQHWWNDRTFVCLDWWEAIWNSSTGTFDQCSSGGLCYPGSGGGDAWQTADYGTAGGCDTCPAPVPEPGTLLMLGSGLVGLAGYGKVRFRRRKK